jgi:hypothetical protein
VRKFIVIFLFSGFYIAAYSQVIKGTVLDEATESPIWYASVYFNGTFVGTTSDENGHFALDISKNASMPISISAIGYYSITLTEVSQDKPITVYLAPKVYELSEVVITARPSSRERKANLKIFRDEFLGTTSNALNCEILNENDITFGVGTDDDTLKAFASKPLLIYNRALGYKITYYLDRFEYYRKSTSFLYKGSIIFKEDLAAYETQQMSLERRRRFTYLGSRTHFFRALWANDIRSSGFVIRSLQNVNLNYRDIVSEEDNQKKFLSFRENLVIYHYTNSGSSYVVFLKDHVYFDSNGYFDPSGISWEGEMARQRIADWLPYEYSIRGNSPDSQPVFLVNSGEPDKPGIKKLSRGNKHVLF